MITLGIDLSSQPEKTGTCLIDWRGGRAAAREPQVGCSDADLDALIAQADAIGIDAPFGWPADFARAVATWPHETWSNELRDRLRFRETDRVVRDSQGRWPLSVSTDQLSMPAMRAMTLLRRHGVTDRSGDGRFFEVYPAASLFAWKISNRGYKEASKEGGIAARRVILGPLQKLTPTLDASDEYLGTSHALDALIASLTAHAAAQGRTAHPAPEVLPIARQEGWIHVPTPAPGV